MLNLSLGHFSSKNQPNVNQLESCQPFLPSISIDGDYLLVRQWFSCVIEKCIENYVFVHCLHACRSEPEVGLLVGCCKGDCIYALRR